jgi:hypothetical protein
VKDLQSRGLLGEVIVMWSGELAGCRFRRRAPDVTTTAAPSRYGWRAVGQEGYTHGATDEIGFTACPESRTKEHQILRKE